MSEARPTMHELFAAKKEDESNQRRIEHEKRRADNDAQLQFSEFFAEFHRLSQEIKEGLDLLDQIDSASLPPKFADLDTKLTGLSEFFSRLAASLPKYDQRQCQETITRLSGDIKARKAALLPKKGLKFSSLRKRNADSDKSGTTAADADAERAALLAAATATAAEITSAAASDRENIDGLRNLSEPQLYDDLAGKTVTITNCDGVTIRIAVPVQTVFIRAVRNCTLLIGPASGSAHIQDCENVTLCVACHQLRIHQSRNISVYLHVQSDAAIQDCAQLRVAPYAFNYKTRDADMQVL
eukprot:TRINITY_DN5824_c0_g1_i3.p1 TRINITY_DN5824_c0_g1~~TRINITY_DN5824_c0_g1_i3.p1  ORF type:complete len:298 (+),score=65.57 TRINITY_DN5824_c0_g1_i3:58-951(+)